MSYVIRFPNAKQDSYYSHYTKMGPRFTFIPSEAYHFPSAVHADNVLQGDERLKGGKVEPYAESV